MLYKKNGRSSKRCLLNDAHTGNDTYPDLLVSFLLIDICSSFWFSLYCEQGMQAGMKMFQFSNIDTIQNIVSTTAIDCCLMSSCQCRSTSVFIVNFEHVSYLFLAYYCWLWKSKSEAHSKPSRTLQMDPFVEIVNSWEQLAIFFLKSSFLNIWLGSQYIFVNDH